MKFSATLSLIALTSGAMLAAAAPQSRSNMMAARDVPQCVNGDGGGHEGTYSTPEECEPKCYCVEQDTQAQCKGICNGNPSVGGQGGVNTSFTCLCQF